MTECIDIHSKGENAPMEEISEISKRNFYPHPFTFDGVECASMEGFLQSTDGGILYIPPSVRFLGKFFLV